MSSTMSARARMIGVVLAVAVPGLIVAAVKNPPFQSGTGISSAKVNENFADLDQRLTVVEGKAPPARVIAMTAERTGNVAPNTPDWTTIPGLSVTLNLAQAAIVQLTGNGVQRTSGSPAKCHVGYRYTVDGAARGSPTWGQRIHVSDETTWHSTWSVIDSATLAAGQHTVALQAHNPSPGGNCYICAEQDGSLEAHDSCTMNVIAVPQ